jgi:ABC-2 type transport system permease protein
MTGTTATITPRTRTLALEEPNTLAVYLRHVIRRHGRGVAFWTVGVTLYAALMILSFPSFESSGALDVSQYPEAMREAFNLQSLSTIEPYLSSQLFNFLPLVLMFVPITIFAGAIVGAEERGSLDILFGNPLPRPVFIVATWLGVAALMLALLMTSGLVSWLVAVAIDVDLSLAESLKASLNVFPITMAAGGLALLLSAMVRQRAIAIGAPAALMFLMYLADIVGKISEDFAVARNLSFFKAYGDPLQEGMPWAGAAVLLAIAVGLAALAIPAFQRRDIYT